MFFISLLNLNPLISLIHLLPMNKVLFFFLTLFLISVETNAQGIDPVVQTIYLIGDTGKDTIPSEVLQMMAFETFDDSLSTILFLGDNVYPEGNNPARWKVAEKEAERKLFSQLELFQTFNGKIYMLPGNHDWSNGKPSGLRAVLHQQQLVDTWFNQKSTVRNRADGVYFKQSGLPGPMATELSAGVRLLLIDSHWWIQQDLFHPVKKTPGLNRRKTGRRALQQLDSLLLESELAGKLSIVAAHHPLASNGKHSHALQPLSALLNYTPLHVLSWFGLSRWLRENLPQPRYKRYRKAVTTILKKYPHAIYVSGHEHTMQYLRPEDLHLIISGSGYSTRPIDRYKYPATFMDDLQPGFFKLTVHQSGNVMLHAYGTRDRGAYWQTLIFRVSAQTE